MLKKENKQPFYGSGIKPSEFSIFYRTICFYLLFFFVILDSNKKFY